MSKYFNNYIPTIYKKIPSSAIVSFIMQTADYSGAFLYKSDDFWLRFNDGTEVAIGSKFDSIDNSISIIQGDITTIEGNITTIQGDITTIQGDITTIQGDISTIEGDISTIEGDIITIQGDISTIESEGGGFRYNDTGNYIDSAHSDYADTHDTIGDYSMDLQLYRTATTNTVTGDYSIALGADNLVSGAGSTVIGAYNIVSNGGIYIIGNSNTVSIPSTLILGSGNTVNTTPADTCLILGGDNSAKGTKSIILGFDSFAEASGAVSIGMANTSSASYAVSIGIDNIASGAQSVSLGTSNSSIGEYSVAIGRYSTPYSYGETIMGIYATAESSPSSATSWVSTDRLFTIGNGQAGAESDALVMLKSGDTTLNGNLIINNNITLTPLSTAPSTPAEGMIYANSTDNTLYAYINSSWNDLLGGGSTSPFTTYDSVSPSAIYVDGRTIGTLGTGSIDLLPTTSTSAGASGDYSIAGGNNSVASGDYSISIGNSTTASGTNSIAFGTGTVTANYAISIGTSASSTYESAISIGTSCSALAVGAVALGLGCEVQTYGQISVGLYPTIYAGTTSSFSSSDPIFIVGNGTGPTARSTAFEIYKDGTSYFTGGVGGLTWLNMDPGSVPSFTSEGLMYVNSSTHTINVYLNGAWYSLDMTAV